MAELERMQGFVDVPLMTRRLEDHKEDAMEELMEVYAEVKEIEGYLSKTINIANFIIQKHQTLFQDCLDMQEELEAIELERQTVEEQGRINDEEMLSFAEVRDRLNLPQEDVFRLLHSLSCAKHQLLVKEPSGKTVRSTDQFKLNTMFQDRMSKIRVSLPPLEQEKKKVMDDVDKDRRYAIDAAVVRTMKARKVLKHAELMAELRCSRVWHLYC